MRIFDLGDRILNSLSVGVALFGIIFDDTGKAVDFELVDINSEFERATGLNREVIIGGTLSQWSYSSDENREFWQDAFDRAVKGEVITELRRSTSLQDDWYLFSVNSPAPGYVTAVFRDLKQIGKTIEEQDRVSEELKSNLQVSEGRFRGFFYNAPSSVIIYEVQNDGATAMDYIIRQANPTCLITEGWSAQDVIGKPLGMVNPGVDNFGIIEKFQEVYKTGKSIKYPEKLYQEEGKPPAWYENIIYKIPTGEIVAIYSDVTKQKITEMELREEKEKLNITLSSIADGIVVTDDEGKVVMLNNAAERLTGWKNSEARRLPVEEVFEICGRKCETQSTTLLTRELRRHFAATFADYPVLITKTGKKRIINYKSAPITTIEQSGSMGDIISFRDVTTSVRRQETIERLSFKDSLTGLYNRNLFTNLYKDIISKDMLPMTVIIGDLMGLKLMNDAFGHQVGDEALQKMAHAIKSASGNDGLVFRWGGDEFLILLPRVGEEPGRDIRDRIREACSRVTVNGIAVKISFGRSARLDMDSSFENVLKAAEDRMYRHKLLYSTSYRSLILSSLKSALFEKSGETEEHGQRIAKNANKLAKRLGFGIDQLDDLEIFAVLHDIGKIAIDNDILTKTERLTDAEWEIIKQHPETGYRIAKNIPELNDIAEYILCHHERWDGKGYPRGLVGEEIPLIARVLSIADAYDAMTADRSYRKALSKEAAKQELLDNAGTQFDPNLIPLFISILD